MKERDLEIDDKLLGITDENETVKTDDKLEE